MTSRPRLVTDTDVALLRTLAREPSVVAASRRVGISRDRANYRLARLAQAFGGPVVTSVRGGRTHGGTQLTPLGDRIVRRGFDSVELLEARPISRTSRPNVVRGVYRSRPSPRVELPGALHLEVAFTGHDGDAVAVLIDPEAILVARGRFASSARNLLRGEVEQVRSQGGSEGSTIIVRVGALPLRAAVTAFSVRRLRLAHGSRVWLYIKATAIRRVRRPGPTRESPPR